MTIPNPHERWTGGEIWNERAFSFDEKRCWIGKLVLFSIGLPNVGKRRQYASGIAKMHVQFCTCIAALSSTINSRNILQE